MVVGIHVICKIRYLCIKTDPRYWIMMKSFLPPGTRPQWCHMSAIASQICVSISTPLFNREIEAWRHCPFVIAWSGKEPKHRQWCCSPGFCIKKTNMLNCGVIVYSTMLKSLHMIIFVDSGKDFPDFLTKNACSVSLFSTYSLWSGEYVLSQKKKTTETERSSGWLSWSSLGTSKVAFHVSSDYQGSTSWRNWRIINILGMFENELRKIANVRVLRVIVTVRKRTKKCMAVMMKPELLLNNVFSPTFVSNLMAWLRKNELLNAKIDRFIKWSIMRTFNETKPY